MAGMDGFATVRFREEHDGSGNRASSAAWPEANRHLPARRLPPSDKSTPRQNVGVRMEIGLENRSAGTTISLTPAAADLLTYHGM
jgi:hypothetical protein